MYLVDIQCPTFDHIEKKHNLYRRKDCIKTFCKSSGEQAKFIVDLEKKKMLPLTEKKQTKITSKCKSMLHLQKKYLTKSKIIKK